MPELEKHNNVFSAMYAGAKASLGLVFNIFFMLLSFIMTIDLSNEIFKEIVEIFGLSMNS